MSKLREAARGQPCMVRFSGICNGDPATTVLAHVRMAGVTGIGQKAHDFLGAWACSACHDEADRRTQITDLFDAQLGFLKGVIRTQAQLVKLGVIK